MLPCHQSIEPFNISCQMICLSFKLTSIYSQGSSKIPFITPNYLLKIKKRIHLNMIYFEESYGSILFLCFLKRSIWVEESLWSVHKGIKFSRNLLDDWVWTSSPLLQKECFSGWPSGWRKRRSAQKWWLKALK